MPRYSVITKAEIEKATWSDTQLKRRKQLSAHTSVVGSGIGLTALGAAAVGSKAGRKVAGKLVRLAPQAKQPGLKRNVKTVRQTARKIQTPLLTAGAGVGGVGGLNYASIQSQEAKRPKPRPVIIKAFDAEKNRHRRRSVETGALAGTSAASLGGAAYLGNQGRKIQQRLNTRTAKVKDAYSFANKTKSAGLRAERTSDAHYQHYRLAQGVGKLKRLRNVKLGGAGALAGVGAASAGGAVALNRHNKRHGASYAPAYRPPR